MRRWLLPDAASGLNPGTPRQRGQNAVTVQGGYGTYFCRHGTNFIEHYACRAVPRTAGRGYKFDRSREIIPGYKVGGGHRRSVAVQFVSDPEISQGAGF